MSAISEKNRAAIFGKLNVSGVTTLATKGVHFMIAPDGTDAPFVVFNRVPVRVDYALGNNVVGEQDMWLIKAVTDKKSSATKSAPELAEDILTACETAIGGVLTLSGNTNRMARRTSEMPNYIEQITDRMFYHHGFYLTVYTE